MAKGNNVGYFGAIFTVLTRRLISPVLNYSYWMGQVAWVWFGCLGRAEFSVFGRLQWRFYRKLEFTGKVEENGEIPGKSSWKLAGRVVEA